MYTINFDLSVNILTWKCWPNQNQNAFIDPTVTCKKVLHSNFIVIIISQVWLICSVYVPHVQMSIDIDQYRSSIGCFTYGSKHRHLVYLPAYIYMFHVNFYLSLMTSFDSAPHFRIILYSDRHQFKNLKGILAIHSILGLTLVINMLILISGNVHPNPGPNKLLKICHSNIKFTLRFLQNGSYLLRTNTTIRYNSYD
jgi:hypothetical protein